MGNEAEKAGIKIRDPQTWKAQADYVFKQMLAHKGDAGWYGGQWHGPRNWAPWALHHFSDPNAVPPSGYATTPPPLPGAAPAPGASTGFGPIEVAIGDSIAKGIDDALGLHAGAGTFADAVGGTTPKQIFERLHGHIKDYAGRSISLASGSNPNAGYDQSQMDAVKKTVKDLHDVGANVVLLGVGAGVKDAAKINAATRFNRQRISLWLYRSNCRRRSATMVSSIRLTRAIVRQSSKLSGQGNRCRQRRGGLTLPVAFGATSSSRRSW